MSTQIKPKPEDIESELGLDRIYADEFKDALTYIIENRNKLKLSDAIIYIDKAYPDMPTKMKMWIALKLGQMDADMTPDPIRKTITANIIETIIMKAKLK